MALRLFRPYISDSAAFRVGAVLSSGYIGEGPVVKAFEKQLDRVLETEGILTTNSCTSALILALKLAGIGRGDVVATTPMTCSATIAAIVSVGATPVWYDVNPLEPPSELLIHHPHPKAIILVSWGGIPLQKVSAKVPVIVDNAHGILTQQPGDYICYSFQAVKHLTTGDGGALLAPKEQQKRARLLRWFGLDRETNEDFRTEQRITESGFKAQMNDIAAAIGLSNLPNLRAIVGQHRRNAEYYCERFSNLKTIECPKFVPEHSYWLFTLLVPDRKGFVKYMENAGIEVSPTHTRNDLHPAYPSSPHPLPQIDYFSSRNISIPVGWWLDLEDLKYISQKVLDYDNGK